MHSVVNLMNLITNELLEQTKQFWKINKHTIFHNAISLVISQQVSFKVGRSVRTKLFMLINSSEITHENMSQLNNNDLEKIGLNQNKVNLIRFILNIKFVNDLDFVNELAKLKGIGVWTIKALQILNLENLNVFLSEDLWIRKRLSELANAKQILTIKECNNFINIYCMINKSNFSNFLWRVRPEGIVALKNNQTLTRDHFL